MSFGSRVAKRLKQKPNICDPWHGARTQPLEALMAVLKIVMLLKIVMVLKMMFMEIMVVML